MKKMNKYRKRFGLTKAVLKVKKINFTLEKASLNLKKPSKARFHHKYRSRENKLKEIKK
jgi:hypothetical protein